MTLDDNLTGISMSAKKGVVEDTNAETIRFRKIIASHGIDAPPNSCTTNTCSFSTEIAPAPPPSKDLLICKEYNMLLQKYYQHRQLLWQKRWETPNPRQEEVV